MVDCQSYTPFADFSCDFRLTDTVEDIEEVIYHNLKKQGYEGLQSDIIVRTEKRESIGKSRENLQDVFAYLVTSKIFVHLLFVGGKSLEKHLTPSLRKIYRTGKFYDSGFDCKSTLERDETSTLQNITLVDPQKICLSLCDRFCKICNLAELSDKNINFVESSHIQDFLHNDFEIIRYEISVCVDSTQDTSVLYALAKTHFKLNEIEVLVNNKSYRKISDITSAVVQLLKKLENIYPS